jgi:hypothetical protein
VVWNVYLNFGITRGEINVNFCPCSHHLPIFPLDMLYIGLTGFDWFVDVGPVVH